MKYNFFHREFEECEQAANKLAVAGSDRELSWAELKQLCLQIAQQIESLNVPQGHPVIIFGHKESTYVAAVLACYHLGITYIPMDTIYPADRIMGIQNQTGSQILIDCSGKNTALSFPVTLIPGNKTLVSVPPDYSEKVYGQKEDPLQYIMFTSGSTGQPKGVMITRKAILSFLKWSMDSFGFHAEDSFMNQAPFTFDVSLCDILNSLSRGASLVLNSRETLSNQILFLERIKKYGCTVWTSTPSFAFLFLRNPDFNTGNIPALKHFLFMGEILPNKTCSILFQKFPECRIANAYGPTEASIVTTHIFITPEILAQFPVLPIGYGKSDGNLRVEKNHEDEEYGELCIGGEHVAQGYFKDPVLTEKKFFVENKLPYFRTGDLAKEENGLWFFGGRNDEQIKLHGFRIELNEITAVIEQYEGINEACVLALKRNSEVKKIIAFVKSSENKALNHSGLQQFLSNKLPYYMVPSDIVAIDRFPTNNSHKTDKNKLLEDYINAGLT